MATQQDDGGSRLWRGMRSLIFGDDGETSLRDQIEEAIDEAETAHPVSGDLSPHERLMLRNLLQMGDRTAGDICVTRGDIVLAHGVCQAEAAAKAIPLEGHAAHLMVHGTLHLLGYDHHDDAAAADMESRETRALARLGIADPYERAR